MRSLTLILLCLFAVLAVAQTNSVDGNAIGFTVLSTNPSNGAVNVPSGPGSISVTFTLPVDPAFYAGQIGQTSGAGMFQNCDSIGNPAISNGGMTLSFPVHLSPNKAYFLLIYGSLAQGGGNLSAPAIVRFSTGASFPAYSVSGTVTSSDPYIPASKAIVLVTKSPIGQKETNDLMSGAICDAGGDFTMPYLGNDTLYTVGAVDVNGDGQIDPGMGDPVGFGPNAIIHNANVTGITIPLQIFPPKHYAESLDTLSHYTPGFPAGAVLRQISASQLDENGGGRWSFEYTTSSPQGGFEVSAEAFSTRIEQMDSMSCVWLSQWTPITTFPTSAAVDTFLARAERSGGNAYRPAVMLPDGFDVRFSAGRLYYSNFYDMLPDISKNYLGVTYWYGTNGQNQSTTIKEMRFLGDYLTGSILGTTGVDQDGSSVPMQTSLSQNYPNPFNPSTTIGFTVGRQGGVSLKVFDLLGREVATLVNEVRNAGTYSVSWNAAGLASGCYVYRLSTGETTISHKLLLMK